MAGGGNDQLSGSLMARPLTRAISGCLPIGRQTIRELLDLDAEVERSSHARALSDRIRKATVICIAPNKISQTLTTTASTSSEIPG